MKHLDALVALYDELDQHLRAAWSDARARDDQPAMERAEEKQRFNDQAYFVICWGQLEAEIDRTCRAAIRTRRAKSAWDDRRAWDLYNPDDRRLSGLSFTDRVALVLDKESGPQSSWALVQSYYATRNQIAHGNVRADRIDLNAVAQDFYRIQRDLTL